MMGFVLSSPAVQGLLVALIVEAVKRSPLGPSSGAPARALAVIVATLASIAVAATEGRLESLDLAGAARTLLEAGATVLAALGAYAATKPARS